MCVHDVASETPPMSVGPLKDEETQPDTLFCERTVHLLQHSLQDKLGASQNTNAMATTFKMKTSDT